MLCRFVAASASIVALVMSADVVAAEPERLVAAINAYRIEANVPALIERVELSRAAAEHAEEMLAQGYLGQVGPDGVTLGERLAHSGFQPPAAREIIVHGVSGVPALIDQMMELRSTRVDLLSNVVTEIGVGHAAGPATLKDGSTVRNLWVLVLADTRITQISDARTSLVTAINRLRTARGLTALTPLLEFERAAQGHAADMVRRGFYAHENPDGATVRDRTTAEGVATIEIGETIAVNGFSADEIALAWSRSDYHAAILFGAGTSRIGTGYHAGPLMLDRRMLRNVWVAVIGEPRRP